MKKLTMWVGMMMMASMAMAAIEPRALTFQEQGHWGATMAVEILGTDLTVDTENVAQTNTFTLSGPCSWSFVAYTLDTPFGNFRQYTTNHVALTTNSVALTVSLGSVTLVSAVQVAEDQWRPYRTIVPTALSIATTTGGPATNLLVSTSTGTWPYSGVLTNGQTITGTVIIGAPGAGSTLNNLTKGRARVFLKVLE